MTTIQKLAVKVKDCGPEVHVQLYLKVAVAAQEGTSARNYTLFYGVPGLRAHPTFHHLPLTATDDARVLDAAHALGISSPPSRPAPAATPRASIAVLPHSFGGSRIELVVQPRGRTQGAVTSTQDGESRTPDAHGTTRSQAYIVCVEYAVPIKADGSAEQGVMASIPLPKCLQNRLIAELSLSSHGLNGSAPTRKAIQAVPEITMTSQLDMKREERGAGIGSRLETFDGTFLSTETLTLRWPHDSLASRLLRHAQEAPYRPAYKTPAGHAKIVSAECVSSLRILPGPEADTGHTLVQIRAQVNGVMQTFPPSKYISVFLHNPEGLRVNQANMCPLDGETMAVLLGRYRETGARVETINPLHPPTSSNQQARLPDPDTTPKRDTVNAAHAQAQRETRSAGGNQASLLRMPLPTTTDDDCSFEASIMVDANEDSIFDLHSLPSTQSLLLDEPLPAGLDTGEEHLTITCPVDSDWLAGTSAGKFCLNILIECRLPHDWLADEAHIVAPTIGIDCDFLQEYLHCDNLGSTWPVELKVVSLDVGEMQSRQPLLARETAPPSPQQEDVFGRIVISGSEHSLSSKSSTGATAAQGGRAARGSTPDETAETTGHFADVSNTSHEAGTETASPELTAQTDLAGSWSLAGTGFIKAVPRAQVKITVDGLLERGRAQVDVGIATGGTLNFALNISDGALRDLFVYAKTADAIKKVRSNVVPAAQSTASGMTIAISVTVPAGFDDVKICIAYEMARSATPAYITLPIFACAVADLSAVVECTGDTSLIPVCPPRCSLACHPGPGGLMCSGSLTASQVVDIMIMGAPGASGVHWRDDNDAESMARLEDTRSGSAARSSTLSVMWLVLLPCLGAILLATIMQIKQQQAEVHNSMIALLDAQASHLAQLQRQMTASIAANDNKHSIATNTTAIATASESPEAYPATDAIHDERFAIEGSTAYADHEQLDAEDARADQETAIGASSGELLVRGESLDTTLMNRSDLTTSLALMSHRLHRYWHRLINLFRWRTPRVLHDPNTNPI